MSNITPKDFFSQENVKAKFNEILGNRSTAFIASVMQVTTTSNLLNKSNPISIYQAAMLAATLDLPINANLGFAYIVPYKGEAQFQLGYKGFVQLAQRSGQFKTISSTKVFEGQIIEENPLTGFEFDWSAKKSDTIVGYVAYFKLINGFEKMLYMSKADIEKHAKKFSQSYGKGFSPWTSDFDSMAEKTVIKRLLSKYAPLSIEMQKAISADQAVIKNADTMEVSYIDNEVSEDKEKERLIELINSANVDELQELKQHCKTDELIEIYAKREEEIYNA